jgi:hypothetical protein
MWGRTTGEEAPMDQLEKDQVLIDEIDGSDVDLSSTESDFIESCMKRTERGQILSEKQRKWAKDIATRIG